MMRLNPAAIIWHAISIEWDIEQSGMGGYEQRLETEHSRK
jgi:hypothetical protein